MGWQVGYDDNWKRWVGYGVPADCDHPDCEASIDRGLAYRCGDLDDCEIGCGLFFCDNHKGFLCDRCANGEEPFEPKTDLREWVEHMLTHDSWAEWRDQNPETVEAMADTIGTPSHPPTGAPDLSVMLADTEWPDEILDVKFHEWRTMTVFELDMTVPVVEIHTARCKERVGEAVPWLADNSVLWVITYPKRNRDNASDHERTKR